MIELTIYNEKTLTATRVRPFAWFAWPMELLREIRYTLAPRPMHTGRPKACIVKRSGDGKWLEHEPTEYATLTPIIRRDTFADPAEFRKKAAI